MKPGSRLVVLSGRSGGGKSMLLAALARRGSSSCQRGSPERTSGAKSPLS